MCYTCGEHQFRYGRKKVQSVKIQQEMTLMEKLSILTDAAKYDVA